MDQERNELLEAALGYTERGWRVIPCDLKTKHPRLKGWHKLATTDSDIIEEWFNGQSNANGISIVFGPSSGLIDIDVDKAEDGDKLCKEAFGGEWPHTPTYLSGNKGTPHRLFQYSKELPNKANMNLRSAASGLDVDIKIGAEDKGSHSLAPPSGNYRWVPGHSPDDCDPAPLPDTFIAWLHNTSPGDRPLLEATGSSVTRSEGYWSEITSGVTEGQRHVKMTQYAGRVIGAWPVLDEAAAKLLVHALLGVNLKNSPPLPDAEVIRIAMDIFRKERSNRTLGGFATMPGENTQDAEQTATDSPATTLEAPQRPAVQPAAVGGMRLVVINSEPSMFELHSVIFEGSRNGCLKLNAKEILSPSAIAHAAMDEAHVVLSTAFKKAWLGKGVLDGLMGAAEIREADPAENWTAIIAQAMLEHLTLKPTTAPEGTPITDGKPAIWPSGLTAFSLRWLRSVIQFDPDRLAQKDLTRVLRLGGAQPKQLRLNNGSKRRFWVIDVDELEPIAYPVSRPPAP